MSAEEKRLIDGKVKKSGMNKTDYLIRALSSQPIICIENVDDLLSELKRQGNNLNQIVKNNYFGLTTEQDIKNALRECKKIYQKLCEIVGGG